MNLAYKMICKTLDFETKPYRNTKRKKNARNINSHTSRQWACVQEQLWLWTQFNRDLKTILTLRSIWIWFRECMCMINSIFDKSVNLHINNIKINRISMSMISQSQNQKCLFSFKNKFWKVFHTLFFSIFFFYMYKCWQCPFD